MRCAVFGPTPGSARSASISRASCGECFIETPHIRAACIPGGSCMPAITLGHLFLHARFHLVHGIVHRGGDQVLEHLAIFADHGGLELHALDLVPARHGHLHHAAAGDAFDFDGGDLRLRLLHVGLHRLRPASSDCRYPEPSGALVDEKLISTAARSPAPAWRRNVRASACTTGSASSARRAASSSSSEARWPACAGVSALGRPATSNSMRTVSPK